MADMGRYLKFLQHIATTTHRPGIRDNKELGHAGVHCAMGRIPGGGLWMKVGKVRGSWQRLPQTRLQGEVHACGRGLQRPTLDLRSQVKGGRGPCMTAQRLHSLQMALDEERRSVGDCCQGTTEAWSTLAGSPGWGCQMLKDLKNPLTLGYITDDVLSSGSADVSLQQEYIWHNVSIRKYI